MYIGSPLGPKYIPYTYMDPLGSKFLSNFGGLGFRVLGLGVYGRILGFRVLGLRVL